MKTAAVLACTAILSLASISSQGIPVTVGDSTPPRLLISSPLASLVNLRTNGNPVIYTIRGRASDNVAVAEIDYTVSNSVDGLSSPMVATGTASWSADISLAPGTNVITFLARDLSGNPSVMLSKTINYIPQSQLFLAVDGPGKVKANWKGSWLDIGKSYNVLAVPNLPKLANAFVGWSSASNGIDTPSNALSFVMTSNMDLTATFIPNPYVYAGGNYNGLYQSPTNIEHIGSGAFTANVGRSGAYSGKIFSCGTNWSFSGKFDLNGNSDPISIQRPGLPPLTMQLYIDLDYDQIFGEIGTVIPFGDVSPVTNWTSEVEADLAVYSKSFPVKTLPGNYTAVTPPIYATNWFSGDLVAGGADLPGGFGYMAMTIASNGIVSVQGGTADGIPFVKSFKLSPVSGADSIPFYLSMYGGAGEIMGWVEFDPAFGFGPAKLMGGKLALPHKDGVGPVTIAVGGDVSWVKTGGTNATYPNGFTNFTVLAGLRYTPPTPSSPRVLNITNGVLAAFSSNLCDLVVTQQVLLSDNNVVLSESSKTKVRFSTKTGLMSGQFVDPCSGTTNKFNGVAIQGVDLSGFGGPTVPPLGLGTFVITNQTGAIGLISSDEATNLPSLFGPFFSTP